MSDHSKHQPQTVTVDIMMLAPFMLNIHWTVVLRQMALYTSEMHGVTVVILTLESIGPVIHGMTWLFY